MTVTSEFRQEQRGVALAMAGALVVTVIVLTTAALIDRTSAPVPFVDRLPSLMQSEVFVVGWLAAAIANVARLRFVNAGDMAGSIAAKPSSEVQVARAILQNTLEQAGLAIPTHLIVAATFTRPTVITTALIGLFFVGRLLFWAGYGRGAVGRAFGFGLTFYPVIAALAASTVVLISGWPR